MFEIMLSLRKYFLILFSFLLFWKFPAAILYIIRAVLCCIKERKASFLCHAYIGYHDSLEIEVAWIFSHVMTQITCITVISKSSVFLGYRVLVRKLLRLPNYLSLVLIMILAIIGFVAIFVVHTKTPLQTIVLLMFMVKSVLSVVLVGISNLTQLELIYPESKMYKVMYKVTVFGLFVDNAFISIVGMVQFAFKVNGLDHNKHSTSSEYYILFSVLRKFSQLIFYYRLTDFYWQKLFMDGNNILSYHQRIGQSEYVRMNDSVYQAI